MATQRETLINEFRDGESPTGAEFKLLIQSIVSRDDDGIDKGSDTALKVSAGKEVHAPIINLCPKDVLDPHWVLSLKVGGKDGLNFAQGSTPTNSVLYLDKTTGNVGIGTGTPTETLVLQKDGNVTNAIQLANATAGEEAKVVVRLKTDDGDGLIYKNSSLRSAQGGFHTMSMINETGDLRLMAAGEKAKIMLKGDVNGFVGINTENPTDALSINGNLSLQGNSMYFALASAGIDTLARTGMFWMGSGRGADIAKHGLYRVEGPWAAPNYQQLRMQFDTGIQLGAGTGVNTGYGKSYVEVINGKGLMVSSGNVGVGTVVPAGKVHVVTTTSEGDVSAWGTGQLVVGQEAGNGPTSGGVGIGYSPTTNTGFISALSPGSSWRTLALRAATILFANGPVELMRLTSEGKLGLGMPAPEAWVEVRKDINTGLRGFAASNINGGPNAFSEYILRSDNSIGTIFKNSSTRTTDGGVNAMTVRNDGGDLRLQAQGGNTNINHLHVRALTGHVGVGTAIPTAKLHVVTASSSGNGGSEGAPFDASSLVVGQELAGGAGSGGIALSYSTVTNAGGISSVSPGVDWRDLTIRAKDTIFYPGGAAETMRIAASGRVGVGTATPDYTLEARKDINSGSWGLGVTNLNGQSDAHTIFTVRTANSLGVLFKNSPTRTADGGVNTMTLRNDFGDLRLQAQGGGNGLQIKAITGSVGIGTANALGKLHIVTPASDGNVSTWDQGQFVVGQEANGGGLGLSYAGNTSFISSLSPGIAWRNMMLRASSISLNTPGAEVLRISNDNMVGIGTPSPKHKLQVTGGNMAIYASDNAALANGGGYPTLGALYFYGHGRNVPNDSASIICGSTTWDDQGYLAFTTSNDGAASFERMRITEAGRIGVNTTAPFAQMHIASTGKAVDGYGLLLGKVGDMIRTSTTFGEELGNIEIAFAGYRDNELNQIGAKISAVRLANYGAPNCQAVQATELAFSTGEGVVAGGGMSMHETCFERLRIKKDGKVGIGTTTPRNMLGVAGNMSIGGLGAANVTAPANGLYVEGDTILDGFSISGKGSRVGRYGTGVPGTFEITTDGASPISNRLIFGTDNTGWKMAISKRTPNGAITDILTVNDDGRVGIGNLYPGGKLHVVTSPSDGIVGSWNDGQLVVGEVGANGGGIALSYSGNTGYLTSLTPGYAWRNMVLRAASVSLNTNNAEVLRVANNNMVGIWNPNPTNFLDIQMAPRTGSHGQGRGLYITGDFGGDNGGLEVRHSNASQGVGIGYNTIYATGYNPSQDLGLKAIGAGNLIFTTGVSTSMLVHGATNRVGIGSVAPEMHLDVRRDVNGGAHEIQAANYNGGSDAYVLMSLRTNSGNGYWFKNSSTRVGDGGVNTMTLRNDGGDTRIQATGAANGLWVKANTGYVGIGTPNAEAALSIGDQGGKWNGPNGLMHITSDSILFGGPNNGRDQNSCQISAGRHSGGASMCIVGMSANSDPWTRRIDIWSEGGVNLNGHLTIGGSNPNKYPIYIPTNTYTWIPEYHYMNPTSVGHAGGTNFYVSMWANARIVCPEFNTVSDARIKKNIVPSIAQDDLLHLQKIKVNDYEYRDQSLKNSLLNKGFIAQQVQEVFPEAVSTHTEFVPDIFAVPIGTALEGPVTREEMVSDGMISGSINAVGKTLKLIMAEPHSLQDGDIVRIGSLTGADDKAVKVVNKTTFTVEDWTHGAEKLFVYGKQVDDFMVVDYNRIYTLNVSATQELHRQVEALKAENTSLRLELDAIKKALGLAGINIEG